MTAVCFARFEWRLPRRAFALLAMTRTATLFVIARPRRGRGNLVQELPIAYKLVRPYRLPLRGRRGDVCERRLWREERAKRSGRIKAIGERASHAMTEPLIQQNMSPPYKNH